MDEGSRVLMDENTLHAMEVLAQRPCTRSELADALKTSEAEASRVLGLLSTRRYAEIRISGDGRVAWELTSLGTERFMRGA